MCIPLEDKTLATSIFRLAGGAACRQSYRARIYTSNSIASYRIQIVRAGMEVRKVLLNDSKQNIIFLIKGLYIPSVIP